MASQEPTVWLTLKGAAQMLGVRTHVIRRLLAMGEMYGVKIGGGIRVSRSSLQVYVESHSIYSPNRWVPRKRGGGLRLSDEGDAV